MYKHDGTQWYTRYGQNCTLVTEGVYMLVKFRITSSSIRLEDDVVEKIMKVVWKENPEIAPRKIAVEISKAIGKDVKVTRRTMADGLYKYYVTINWQTKGIC